MADVVFLGLGNTGFPDPRVQILPANPAQSAEVTFGGLAPNVPGELSTQSETFSPTLTAAPEFTEVEFFEPKASVTPASLNPNDNILIYIVTGGNTNPAADGFQIINVIARQAQKIEGEDFIEQPPVPIDLRGFAQPRIPSGVVGNIAQFIQPTGVDFYDPIRGVTGRIQAIAGIPTGPTAFSGNGLLWGGAIVSIIFEGVLPVQATGGDRFFIDADDRVLRRSPVIEVILE